MVCILVEQVSLQFLPCITNMNSKIAITKQTLDSDWHSNHPNYGLVELCNYSESAFLQLVPSNLGVS